METKKLGPGGARVGGGRKPLDPNADTIPVTIKMSEPQKAKYKRLGGAPWVRARIDKAQEPSPTGPDIKSARLTRPRKTS
jgi:hypothetical protein